MSMVEENLEKEEFVGTTVELEDDLEHHFSEILHAKSLIKNVQQSIKEHEAVIKEHMQENKHALCGTHRATWGSRTYKAQKEKIVPAKEAYTIRSKTLSIKEEDYGLD